VALFDQVHNFYERMVIDYVMTRIASTAAKRDDDFLEDVVCVALNNLPPRYVRYRVDAAFYLTTAQRDDIEHRVATAVDEAVAFVENRRRLDRDSA